MYFVSNTYIFLYFIRCLSNSAWKIVEYCNVLTTMFYTSFLKFKCIRKCLSASVWSLSHFFFLHGQVSSGQFCLHHLPVHLTAHYQILLIACTFFRKKPKVQRHHILNVFHNLLPPFIVCMTVISIHLLMSYARYGQTKNINRSPVCFCISSMP